MTPTTTTIQPLEVDAKAYQIATVHLDEPIDIERSIGHHGKKKTIRVVSIRIRWFISLTAEHPRWRPAETLQAFNVLKDGTLGAPVKVWEYFGYDRKNTRTPLEEFVGKAIESTRPATVPTLKIEA